MSGIEESTGTGQEHKHRGANMSDPPGKEEFDAGLSRIYRVNGTGAHEQPDMIQGHNDHYKSSKQIDGLYPKAVGV